MLSRALEDYDVRLRYYIVQSMNVLNKYKSKGITSSRNVRNTIRAARDWKTQITNLFQSLTCTILSSGRLKYEQKWTEFWPQMSENAIRPDSWSPATGVARKERPRCEVTSANWRKPGVFRVWLNLPVVDEAKPPDEGFKD